MKCWFKEFEQFTATLPPTIINRLTLQPPPASFADQGPCCIYRGPRMSRNGYGRIWSCTHKKEIQLHRKTWMGVHGSIPPKMVLDHLCKTRNCVATWHLEPVTGRENTLRGNAILFRVDYDETPKNPLGHIRNIA